MTTFDDRFALAATRLAGQFGETLSYRPRNGRARTITAISIDRNPPESMDGIERAPAPRIIIEVYNDEQLGVASHLLDTGGDKVDVQWRKGGPFETRSIVKLLDDDAGVCQLEVR